MTAVGGMRNGTKTASGERQSESWRSNGTPPLVPPTALSTRAIEAEQAVLGCVLIDDFEVWGELEEFPLEAEDFLMREHKALWRAFRWLHDQGMEVTMPSTVYALDRMDMHDTVDEWLAPLDGVRTYLIELLQSTWSAKGCGAFLRAVKHYSDMRAPISPRKQREIVLE
jgi:replicative DNA helicase